MSKKRWVIYIFFILPIFGRLNTAAQQRILLNDDWTFHFTKDVRPQAEPARISLPHTWNSRESGTYNRTLFARAEWANKRVFLYFGGANSVADVFINQKFVGEHKGGYTSFCLEITHLLNIGRNNTITVLVSNAYRTDVLPLSGDFNVYGGLHRSVSLLIKEKDCISPLDHASSGVYFIQKNVSEQQAEINTRIILSLQGGNRNLRIRTRLFDRAGTEVAKTISIVTTDQVLSQQLLLNHPHLWNGREDPYCYHARVELLAGSKILDDEEEIIGLRYFSIDAQKGFFLNGKYLDLHGLGRHEDLEGKGSALSTADEERDMGLIKEIGATALRLTHYPQGKYFYDLCDRNGLIVWSEIPLVGPGGYTGTGYTANPLLQQHAKDVLVEMIRQNFNHPSICFWGLFNELKLDYDNPVPFLKQLRKLATKEDPTRLTTCASFLDNDTFNGVSDLIAWNKYYGWYGGVPEDLGKWADEQHRKFPLKPIAISEYGAGASPFQHTDSMVMPPAGGKFHPEEWQSYFHEKNWEQLYTRKFLWAKFVWVLSDFGSAIRDEGAKSGMNDKGLVTYDRQIKKDAFYFYKANWNPDPMVYITDRRFDQRKVRKTTVKVYTNLATAELFLNGVSEGKRKADDLHRVLWENILLNTGKNNLRVVASDKKITREDTCKWILQ